MSLALRRSLAARRDLLEIWLSIATDDMLAADRHLDRIEEAITGLAEFPFLGAAPPELGEGMRAVLRTPFLIVYRANEGQGEVEIVRIVDARRNLSILFHQ